MRHPCTTFLGHPTGRLLLGRKGYEVDLDRILEVAAETGTLIEINANPYRLDLDWTHLEKARRMGVRFSIDPDTHRKSDLGDYVYGVGIARKGWLTAADAGVSARGRLPMADLPVCLRALQEQALLRRIPQADPGRGARRALRLRRRGAYPGPAPLFRGIGSVLNPDGTVRNQRQDQGTPKGAGLRLQTGAQNRLKVLNGPGQGLDVRLQDPVTP
jgi:hypothetical protein